MKECPVCRQSLKNDKLLSNGTHLINHFKENFDKLLNLKNNENPLNVCPTCKQQCSDSLELKLHFGLTHGEIEKQIVEAKKKRLSVKSIILKVDGMKSCKICDMIYSNHMMGKPEIRRHLLTEHRLQNDILQKVSTVLEVLIWSCFIYVYCLPTRTFVTAKKKLEILQFSTSSSFFKI